MNDSRTLTFINNKTKDDLNELWKNCFAGQRNLDHMNSHVPIPVTQQWQLNGFLTNGNGNDYSTWLIKRKTGQEIIGFALHGNFIPGLPNNIGFNIGLDYTRNGYATESLQALIDYIKGTGLPETFGHCFETNKASINTMEKSGFQNMGRTGRIFNEIHELKFKIQL